VTPHLFALANVVLERAEAFRFALSPVGEWLPARSPDWGRAVEVTGREWSIWVEDPSAAEVIGDAPVAAQILAWPSSRDRDW
jgi:hypothetical protein